MEPVRVCYAAKEILSPPTEGHHVISKRMVEAAIRTGIDCKVVTVESEIKTLKGFENWTIVNSKTDTLTHNRRLLSLFTPFRELVPAINIAAYTRNYNCDLVHTLNITKETYLVAHKLLRVGKPLLMHFYHSQHVLADNVFLIRDIMFKIGFYGRTRRSHVLTTNLALSQFLTEKYGIDSEHVHFAPCPIDTDVIKPLDNKENLREKYGLPKDCYVAAYVGSLNPVRGLGTLIKSFDKILSKFPQLLLFISHPENESEEIYEAQLREQMKTTLQKNMLIVGPSAHVEEIYNLADVIVLPFERPYWVDPPLVLLEAMSSGVPLVSTAVGAIGGIIKDHENAIVTEPQNPETIAKAVVELMENPNIALKLAKKARETIIQDYSYQSVGEKLRRIYSSVLDTS